MTFNASVRHYEPRGHLFNIKNQLTWRYFTQILSQDASQPVLVTSPNWNIPLDTSNDEEPISSALCYQEFQNTAVGMSPTDNSEKENYSDHQMGPIISHFAAYQMTITQHPNTNIQINLMFIIGCSKKAATKSRH